MTNVIQMRRPRKVGIKGAARKALTDAFRSVKGMNAMVVVVLGDDGTYAMRVAMKKDAHEFDVYARAGAVIEKIKMGTLD